MKTEIELHLNRAPEYAYDKTVPEGHFQQRTRMFDHGVMLCAAGVQRYVKLPKDTRQITLRFFKTQVAESFEIGRREVRSHKHQSLLFRETRQYCMVDHPKTQLLQSFRSELFRYYIKGFKFFRIEY